MREFSGFQYLLINLANAAGQDKLSWEKRIEWAKAHLEDSHLNQEEPANFLVTQLAIVDALEGKPSGALVDLDATNSGLQILSCLAHDKESAKLCNVIDVNKRADAYSIIYESMKLRGASQGVSRADCKKAVMTSLYGSQAVPRSIFKGKDLKIFFDTMEDLCPKAWKLNEAFLNAWDNTAYSYEWTLPDGFKVIDSITSIEYRNVPFNGTYVQVEFRVNKPREEGRSLGANIVHSIDGYIVRELVRRAMYDREELALVKFFLENNISNPKETTASKEVEKLWNLYKKTGMLSAKILHVLDEHSIHLVDKDIVLDLINSLPAKSFDVLTIHDAFRVHPNYGNDLRKLYRKLLQEVVDSHLLSWIKECIKANFSLEPYEGSFTVNGEYALC